MSKETTVFDSEHNTYKVMRKNSKGDETVTDTVDAIERMETSQALDVFQGLVSEAPNKRRAVVSLLCAIMAANLSDLQAWQGKGNKRTGQLSNELKEQFRKAEDAFFGRFIAKDYQHRDAFIGRLPKVNERGIPIEEDGTENVQARLNYFVTATRKDANYANNKNLVLSFFAFVGNLPYDEEKGSIMPPEVMRVMVNNAKDVTPTDTSYRARLTNIIRELTVPANPEKPVTIPDEHITGLRQDAQRLLDELTRLERLAAQRAATKTKAGDVVAQTAAAMEQAKGLPATPPGDGAVRVVEATLV